MYMNIEQVKYASSILSLCLLYLSWGNTIKELFLSLQTSTSEISTLLNKYRADFALGVGSDINIKYRIKEIVPLKGNLFYNSLQGLTEVPRH